MGIGWEGWEGASGWRENGAVDGVAGDDGGGRAVVGRHESRVVDRVIGNDGIGRMGQAGWGHGCRWLAQECNDRWGNGG